jgi:hypothetical protein
MDSLTMSLENQPLWNFPTSVPAPPPREAVPASAAPILTSSHELKREDLLAPRRIGGVFDLAFDIYRAHFRTLLTTVVVLLLPMQAVLYVLYNTWLKPLSNYADAHSDDAGPALTLIGGGMLTGVPHFGIPGMLSLLILAVTSAPVAIAIADIYRGSTPYWLDCYRRVFHQIPRVIGGWIIVALAFVTVLCFTFVLCFILLICAGILFRNSGRMPDVVAVVLFVLGTVLPYVLGMTLVAFNFCFTTPLIVLENLPITLIPSRNWQLVGKRRALRTWAAIVFLPLVFFTVQGFMLGSISSFLGLLLGLFAIPPLYQFTIETTLTILLIAFLQPYLLVFLNVLYFDFRIQREGLDIRLLADDLLPATRTEAGR